MLLFFSGGLVGVDKHLYNMVSLVTFMTLSIIFSFYYSPLSKLFQNN